MIKSKIVREIQLNADESVNSLLALSERKNVCILDSGGVSYLDAHLLIGGIEPVKLLSVSGQTTDETFRMLEREISRENLAAIFTISYDFGLKMHKIRPRQKEFSEFDEPDIFLALFDVLLVHDYKTAKTFLRGNESNFAKYEKMLIDVKVESGSKNSRNSNAESKITSNFTRLKYLHTIEKIKDFIRRGDTYQTNLTQQFRAELPDDLTPQRIFMNLRSHHPAPFSAFMRRENDFVVSVSPERFFKIEDSQTQPRNRIISTSPIKGTRSRGKDAMEDLILREELTKSPKERAENIMIVDLLRNDLGRVCKFGSVKVTKLCDLEEHPTFFHLVSTVQGDLSEGVNLSDILKAVFPCGSITGAPKIRTMQIIDEIETANRGLSMGAIGHFIPDSFSKIKPKKTVVQNYSSFRGLNSICEMSVAIRTMVIRNNVALFNVGGGIVIDSVPEDEYLESLTKARALLDSLNADWRS